MSGSEPEGPRFDSSREGQISPEMIAAGVAEIEELAGAVSKAFLAKAVYEAMWRARPLDRE